MSQVILLTAMSGEALTRATRAFGTDAAVLPIANREALGSIDFSVDVALVTFNTGIIVQSTLLKQLRRPAYNLHPASPDFPGRDPHHHAIFRRAQHYGATLHRLCASVDSGEIVGVEMFPVSADATPDGLLADATEAGLRLLERFGPRIAAGTPLPRLPDVFWGPVKTCRADLKALCALSPLISDEEFERRFHAFDGGVYNNLTVDLHGWTFRIDKSVPRAENAAPARRTEDDYRDLIRTVTQCGYRFASYREPPSGRCIRWRHDVHVSLHRAARLAEIEAREGVRATYLLSLRSPYFSLLECDLASLARRIASLGHTLGLLSGEVGEHNELDLAREAALMADILDLPIDFVGGNAQGKIRNGSAPVDVDHLAAAEGGAFWSDAEDRAVFDAHLEAGSSPLHVRVHPDVWLPVAPGWTCSTERALLGRARTVGAHLSADGPTGP